MTTNQDKSLQDVATFKSDLFNLTESKDYFVNPGCFGDDLARWLIERLRGKGVEVDPEPDQEDFGWYFNFVAADVPCCAVIGNVEESSWFVVIERRCGRIA